MREKIIVYSLIAFFFLISFAYAQVWPSAEYILEQVQTELNLTQEQFTQVKLILDENIIKRKNVTPQLAQGLTQAQSRPLDTELYNKLSEVLTQSQMNQWLKILKFLYINDGDK